MLTPWRSAKGWRKFIELLRLNVILCDKGEMILGTLFTLLVWRVWAMGAALLFLNSVARFLFKPSKKGLFDSLGAIPFIAVWPLAIFSPQGRKIIFKKIKGV